ncbi:hypothetical protein OIU76_011910 [Salix suchowensis]|nr:hypothetical protein OIU76_011910 [Salix suchowensis]
MDSHNCVHLFEKCHPAIPLLQFDPFCMARENHTGDVHFSNPYLVKIRHSRWPTKIVTFFNSRLPNVELYAYHVSICCSFLQTL